MKFKDLPNVIEEVVEKTFSDNVAVKRILYESASKDQTGLYYILIKEDNRHILLSIPKDIKYTSYYVIRDFETFNKEFWISSNREWYLITEEHISDEINLLPYEAYRFINEMKRQGFKLPGLIK